MASADEQMRRKSRQCLNTFFATSNASSASCLRVEPAPNSIRQPSTGRSTTAMGAPFSVAPRPASAQNTSSAKGLYTTPNTGRPSSTSASDTDDML